MQTEQQDFVGQDWPSQPLTEAQAKSVEQKTNTPELDPNKLKGVYREEAGLHRAAIRPLNGTKWYTLGYFVCPHVAGHVFNIYALTMGLPHLVNHGLEPDAEELQKWRERRTENAKRENLAMVEYHKQWGNKQ